MWHLAARPITGLLIFVDADVGCKAASSLPCHGCPWPLLLQPLQPPVLLLLLLPPLLRGLLPTPLLLLMSLLLQVAADATAWRFVCLAVAPSAAASDGMPLCWQ